MFKHFGTAAVCALLAAAPAAAQGPTTDAYGGAGTIVPSVAGQSGAPVDLPAVPPQVRSEAGADVVPSPSGDEGIRGEAGKVRGAGAAAPVTQDGTVSEGATAATPLADSGSSRASSGDTLPFTGLDAGLLAAGSLLLLLLGFGLRRLGRPAADPALAA